MTFGERRIKVVGVGGTPREGSAGPRALMRALAAAGEAGAETEVQRADGSGNVTDELYRRRLDSLGDLVVDLAGGLAARDGRAELAGVAG